MKKFRRIMALGLAGVLTAAALAGCGSSAGNETAPAATEEAAAADTAADAAEATPPF